MLWIKELNSTSRPASPIHSPALFRIAPFAAGRNPFPGPGVTIAFCFSPSYGLPCHLLPRLCFCPRPSLISRSASPNACTGAPSRTRRLSSASKTSCAKCARAATRPCWPSRPGLTGCPPPAWPRWSCKRLTCRRPSRACPPRSARRWSRRPRAFAAITSGRKSRAAKPPRTLMKTALCWARKSRRWTAWAFTCPAARRPTLPAC